MKRSGGGVKAWVGVVVAGMVWGGYDNNALAQWPTNYTSPLVLSSGHNLRAAAVVTANNDDAVVAYSTPAGNSQKVGFQKYNGAGLPLYSSNGIYYMIQPVTGLQVFNKAGDEKFYLGTALAQSDVLGNTKPTMGIRQLIVGSSGYFSFAAFPLAQYLTGVAMPNGKFFNLNYDWEKQELFASPLEVTPSNGVAVKYARPRNASMIASSPSRAIYTFTKVGLSSLTPSKVFIGNHDQYLNVLSEPVLVENQGVEEQSHSQLTGLTSTQFMVTWLGRLNDVDHLYAKVVDSYGVEVTGARQVMADVISYQCAESTLGNPVFAGVTRTGDGAAATDTVFAGILDPTSGGSLRLPLATGSNAKVKYIHQEASGDFTVAYSMLENGTNLLKVLRISAATAGVAWQTTVADLGVASDEFLEEYPNTWISSTSTDALYVITRKDTLNSDNTSLNMVRVRADGALGSDNLKPPTDFRTTGAAAGAVSLAWTDNSNSETHYLVGRTTTDFSGIEIIGTLDANTSSFTDTTAAPGTTYTYYVAPYQSGSGNFALSEPLVVHLM